MIIYTFMRDMVAGTFRCHQEDQVKVTDGTSCGFPANADFWEDSKGGGMTIPSPT